LGERVTIVDPEDNTIQIGPNRRITFDQLLISSGADPRPILSEGDGLGNIFYMRTQTDVRNILQSLPGVRRAVVLGEGLVGFKAAYGLLKHNIPVTMLITSGYPLSIGAVDMMMVDYQCIMPSLGTIAKHYHTKLISTSDKA
jgi:NADPH-dependent 2,4-dienoyl-CoA reductase/sulfur reductase-like enzyme